VFARPVVPAVTIFRKDLYGWRDRFLAAATAASLPNCGAPARFPIPIRRAFTMPMGGAVVNCGEGVGTSSRSSAVTSGVNFTESHRFEFPYDGERLQPRSDQGCHRARANQGQALRVAAKDAASLDRPCARRLRDLAVGTEECSRRGSNQRMDPKRTRKLAISNRWF
jgi:hypothetical protein